MDKAYFYDESVGKLQVLLEEVTRARPGSPETRFINSDTGTIDRLGAKFHHVLFGRRGAGKSSLLRHIESVRRDEGGLVAWADQETFQGLSYPDVLLSTLEEAFLQFGRQLRPAMAEQEKRSWLRRDRREKTRHERVAEDLDSAVAQLATLKAAPNEAEIEWTASIERASTAERASAFNASASNGLFSLRAIRRKRQANRQSTTDNRIQRYKTTKAEHLERAVSSYRDLMLAVSSVVPDSFVILDDFYRLAEADQPRIAGYFHRVVKDTGVWLKIGTIRYWTNLYAGGSPPVGVQVANDIRELSLDRGLLDFKTSKRFLEEILGALTNEAGVDADALFSQGARDRLVLASGGVPRDYISLVSESIAVAKNRGPSNKSGTDRVIAEDVNEAAGRTVETKFTDLDVDAGEDAQDLRELVVDVTNHCRRTASACFLADFRDEGLVRQLNRLQNMRFIHSLDMNESLPDPKSSRYNVYLLDVSQLAAQRAWQVDFMGWQQREKRRARKLVFRQGEVGKDGAADTQVSKPSGGQDPEQLSLDDAHAVVGDVDPPVTAPS